jgi:hypothetical protein
MNPSEWDLATMNIAIRLCLATFPDEALESLAEGDRDALETFSKYAKLVLERRAMAENN